ncbi:MULTISPECIES: lactate utilization protein B [Brevibacterium]|uniref:LutB/LldF family L-lactate oxidation iron-sulfur protein n=1 Tax=Brevibacterium salitolerans TaxID=1403566 RepID=A0ABN2WUB1_9MICO|nr:lactate utilization protein B [Brevibacterium sp.]
MTTFLGMPALGTPSRHIDHARVPASIPGAQGNVFEFEDFPDYAERELGNDQLRRNLGHATSTIRTKRANVVGELPDWEELRSAGSAVKQTVMAHLPELLDQFAEAFEAAGGHVHWARDAAEANNIVEGLIEANAPILDNGRREVVKVKSMATQEIGLNEYLEPRGIDAFETDLAELIVQLGHDKPSHILVPAIHKNRTEIRDIFLAEMPEVDPALTDEPAKLAEAARTHLRHKFLTTKVAISGANFGIASNGTLGVVESEGNGRMCLTLPETLITVMGIEKLLPAPEDLEVFLQLLPRSSTGERMNPYTSFWTGVTPGDGPQNVHVVLLDNGRSRALADEYGRSALHCIRCSACMNVCPVYERTGGHAYGSTYPGPIGAILSPLLTGVQAEENDSLPYASSLCGACYSACPVKIDIPSILVHLRGEDHEAKEQAAAEAGPVQRAKDLAGPAGQLNAGLKAASWAMADGRRIALAERALPLASLLGARSGRIRRMPGVVGTWTSSRDVPRLPDQSFRTWWRKNRGTASGAGHDRDTAAKEGDR